MGEGLVELTKRYFDWQNFSLGARRFMIGMCMKVLVADTLSPLVDVAFHLDNPSFVDAWIGCLAGWQPRKAVCLSAGVRATASCSASK